MNITKKDILFDIIFVAVLLICVLAVAFSYSPAKAEMSEHTAQEPTTAATSKETVKPTQESTETEPPDTEETQPPVILYDVPLDADLQLHIISEAEAHGIDPAIIFAMAFEESTYRTDAVGDGGDSYGLLQVQPYWHYDRMIRLGCTDLLDPFQNVTVAVDYLAEKLNVHGGDMAKALTAYNKGHFPGYVTQYAQSVMATAEELAVAG